MKKYQTALFIGRFQPFHNGHLYSLKKCLELAEQVIVGVGSSQESRTESNPLSYSVRHKMIEAVVEGKGLVSKIKKIVPIPDYPSDEQWLAETVKIAGEFDIVVSNNEWTLKVFREAGYTVAESGLYNRNELEGAKIRTLMREGRSDWDMRVPKEVVQNIGDWIGQKDGKLI